MRHVLTSEAVTRGHPDKLCDQVADGVLDALLTEDPEARAACEAAVWENHLLFVRRDQRPAGTGLRGCGPGGTAGHRL